MGRCQPTSLHFSNRRQHRYFELSGRDGDLPWPTPLPDPPRWAALHLKYSAVSPHVALSAPLSDHALANARRTHQVPLIAAWISCFVAVGLGIQSDNLVLGLFGGLLLAGGFTFMAWAAPASRDTATSWGALPVGSVATVFPSASVMIEAVLSFLLVMTRDWDDAPTAGRIRSARARDERMAGLGGEGVRRER